MINPPFLGIQNKIWPYAPLQMYDTIMKEKGYIAGVTNPVFMSNAKGYDLCCQVDEGKIKVTKIGVDLFKEYER